MSRGRNMAKLRPIIQEWARSWQVHELSAQARARNIPIVPLATMADVYRDEQLMAREFSPPYPLAMRTGRRCWRRDIPSNRPPLSGRRDSVRRRGWESITPRSLR